MGSMKEFLSIQERQELREAHRREKDRRAGDRMKAVLLSDMGWTFKEIAEALFLDEETISHHVDDYIRDKKLRIQTGGSQGKLSKDQVAELSHHLEETTYVKVQEICVYVEVTYGVIYTVSGMTFWLKSHGFSYKKPKGTPAKADSAKQEAFIKVYEELLKTAPEDEPILFGDGVHPTMATKITYGWIKKGTDKLIATTASRTRMNLMGVLNLETMSVLVSDYETLDSDAMVTYLAKIRKAHPTAQKIHLILDQGPYNTSHKTKEAAREQGIILHHLPPYSPNLNPIERLWKVMNEYVRNNVFFKNAQEFKQAILDFFQLTWPLIATSMTDRINDNFQRLKSSV